MGVGDEVVDVTQVHIAKSGRRPHEYPRPIFDYGRPFPLKPPPVAGTVVDEFTQSMQLVSVFHMGYCSNDYTVNGLTLLNKNLVLRSEEPGTTPWVKAASITILEDDPDTLDPIGGTSAAKITAVDINSNFRQEIIDVGPVAVTGRTFTLSFYAKRVPLTGPNKATNHFMGASVDESFQTNGRSANWDLRDADGWKRFIMPVTIGTQVVSPRIRIQIFPHTTGNPVGTYEIWVWGFQILEGPLALRYAKTLGTGTEAECSTCTALDLGDKQRCYYSFQTCQDLIHFDGIDDAGRTITPNVRKWAFSLRKGYDLNPELQLGGSVTQVRPYIIDTNYMSQKIDPRRAVTQSTRITLKMSEDFNPGLFDTNKTLNNTGGDGSFWRLWERRYRNFVHRKVELWLVPENTGVLEDPLTSYRVFIGLIEDIQFNSDGTVNIVLKDILKKTRDRIPNAISPENVTGVVLTASASETTIPVLGNLLEFTDPAGLKALTGSTATKVGLRLGELQDSQEIMTLVSIDQAGGSIEVVRAQYNTGLESHPVNSKITEVIVYRDPSTDVGLNPVDIMYDILTRSGIDPEFFDENSFITEKDTWIADKTMSRIIEEPEDSERLLREIRELMFAAIWVNEEQKIQFKLLAPSSLISGDLSLISDEANLISRSVSVNVDDRSRINRVILFYDPVDYQAGTNDRKSYKQQIYLEDVGSTDPRNYGKTTPPLRIFTKWFRASEQVGAEFFAKKIATVYQNGLPIYTFDMDFKDRLNRVGDYVNIKSRDHVDVNGDPQISELFITEKKRKSKTEFSYVAVSLRDKPRYALIAPSGTPNFTATESTAEERRKFAYIGNKENRLGNNTVEGVRSW